MSQSQEQQNDVMVSVNNVTMSFNMASEQLNSLKEYFIKLLKHELFFREFRALEDISFEVNRGDVFGIIGTNGSGKSTMMKIIAGVLEPSKGSVQVNGNIAPLIELGAGFDYELTARENIYLNGALLGYSREFIDQHFNDIVAFAELDDFLDMPMKNYSSGMVARVAFAIATIIVPDILIVDEVLSVGDYMFQQKCENRIQELIHNYGVTVLLVSHSNDQVERLCNKAIWIERGNMRMIGSAKEVCAQYRLLGGKGGVVESEKKVATQLQFLGDSQYASERAMFTGEDLYSLTGRAVGSEWRHTHVDTVVLAVAGNDFGAMIGNRVAGIADAPVLMTKYEALSEAAIRQIERLTPNNIVVIDSTGNLQPSVVEELRDLLPEHVSIDVHSNADTVQLSMELNAAYPYESDTAVVGSTWILTDFVSLSPYVYTQHPALVVTEPQHITSETVEYLKGFKRVLVMGLDIDITDSTVDELKAAGVEVVRLGGKDAHDTNQIMIDWMLDQKLGFSLQNLYVGVAAHSADMIAFGPIAGRNKSLIFYVDPEDLDTVASGITYLKKNHEGISKLLFVGGSERFSDTDQRLLASCLH